MAKSDRQRKPKNRSSRSRTSESSKPRQPTAAPIKAQIPRPPITEYTIIKAVPVFATGEAGPPAGSHGDYEVTFVLGVPGINSVTSEMDFQTVRDSGDSLLSGAWQKVEYAFASDQPMREFSFGCGSSEVTLRRLA